MKLTSNTLAVVAALICVIMGGALLLWYMNQGDMLPDMLTETYGQYDAEKKVWRTIDGTSSDQIHSNCAEHEIDVRGEKHLMLAICGFSEDLDSHGTPGSIDFYVLKG